MQVDFRWLGVGGVELKTEGRTLVIDPFTTRPSIWRVLFGRARPDEALVSEVVPQCDFVLVTHPHYDHLMDVPVVVRRTGAVAYGSANTCQLLGALGVPAEQVREIGVGDQLELGPYRVSVLPAEHIRLPIDRLVSGALPPYLRPPLRFSDYKMDTCFSFLVEVPPLRILVGNQPAPAEVLFVNPLHEEAFYPPLLERVRPRLVVPVHWENFFQPLSQPPRPMLKPASSGFVPFQRVNLDEFSSMVAEVVPEARVLLPQVLRSYPLI